MKDSTTFRLDSHATINSMIEQFTYDLDLFIYKISAFHYKPITLFSQWKYVVINTFQIVLKNNTS